MNYILTEYRHGKIIEETEYEHLYDAIEDGQATVRWSMGEYRIKHIEIKFPLWGNKFMACKAKDVCDGGGDPRRSTAGWVGTRRVR